VVQIEAAHCRGRIGVHATRQYSMLNVLLLSFPILYCENSNGGWWLQLF